ncbi:MAG TPA: hypothetical protein V6D23_21635 [Candidatus Obscuribacterales bacterium]
MQARGQQLEAADRNSISEAIRAQFEAESNAFYFSARVLDDGLIDPAETRGILGRSLAIVAQAPPTEGGFGVLRM